MIYLDVPLTSPDSGVAVDLANRQGFFYGALLPARKFGDMLRLQKLMRPDSIVPGEMKLCSDDVQQMLDFILDDARRVMEVLKTLIERESARRLACLGGTEPALQEIPRHQTKTA